MKSKDSEDDTRIVVTYESECKVSPNGKHKWRSGEGVVGYTPCLECVHCGAITNQRKLCD